MADGQKAKAGCIIIRQRGSKYLAGKNVGCGTDYTLFALKEGIVKFRTTQKTTFQGLKRKAKVVEIV